MTRAALYARVSTDEQAERYGLASQVTALRAEAAERGYVVPRGAEYVDDGYSGATLDRPALTRLREAIRRKSVDVVLAYSSDRLARELFLMLLLKREFAATDVSLVYVNATFEETPMGVAFEQITGVMTQLERATILDRTLRGKREKAREGKVVAAFPYGYRLDPAKPGHLLIYEPEARVIRQMYDWLLDDGKSSRAILEELRRQGVPPVKAGRRWGTTQVYRILSSDRYTGHVYYGQRQSVPGGSRRKRPESEWIPVPIPAIVTPERHAAAVAKLKGNRAALVGRPANFVYLLRGLLRCEVCGARYETVPAHGRRYYRCRRQDRLVDGPRCRAPWLSALVGEAAVWNAVAETLSKPDALQQAAEAYETSAGVRDVELRSRVEHLRGKLRRVEQKEARLLELYVEDGVQADKVASLLQQLAKERAGLSAELQQAEAKATAHGALSTRQDAIERICAQARRGLGRLDDNGRQKLLGTLVDEIRVGADRTLTIYGVLQGETADTILRLPS
jgi:site-specific DNA recombinase